MRLDVFVTAHIEGDLDLMPRLYTAIRGAKDTVPGASLLIDTGRAWDAKSWICGATENRAPYFVLDAMGYDAAFADGLVHFDKLHGELQMQLLVPEAQFAYDVNGVKLSLGVATNTDEAAIQSGQVRLPMPSQGVILHLTLDLTQDSAPQQIIQQTIIQQTIIQQTIIRLTDAHLPDPTIAGAVEFIVSEARYYQKKREAAS